MNRQELQKEFDRIVDKIKNGGSDNCKKALDTFEHELYLLRNKEFPASIKHHHTDNDGLLRHTIEVCHILEMFEPNFTYLLTAGLLHDIGKVYDYVATTDLNENVVFADDGSNYLFSKDSERNINHSQYAYAILSQIDEFVADLVGCHMGKVEFGAVFDLDDLLSKKRKFNDKMFYLLHFADMVSSKLLLGGQNAFQKETY